MKKLFVVPMITFTMLLAACGQETVEEKKKEEKQVNSMTIQEAIEIEEEVFHVWKDQMGYNRVTYSAVIENNSDEARIFQIDKRDMVNQSGESVASFINNITSPHVIQPGGKVYYNDTTLLEIPTDEQELHGDFSFEPTELAGPNAKPEDLILLETKDIKVDTSPDEKGNAEFTVVATVLNDKDKEKDIDEYGAVAVLRDEKGALVAVMNGLGNFSENPKTSEVYFANDTEYENYGPIPEGTKLKAEVYAYYWNAN